MQVVIAAPWVRRTQQFTPGRDAPGDVTCVNLFGAVLGRASARAESDGSVASGRGSAWDTSLGCDVLNVAVATGLSSRSYAYVGTKTGEVEMNANVNATGRANLVDADCAAAALGYSEFSSNITPTITAILSQSAGQTSSSQLGNVGVAYGGLQVGVNVTVGTGTGSYSDQDTNATNMVARTGYYFLQHRARAYIKVWANEDLWGISASCNADMQATVDSFSFLYEI